MMRTKKYRTNRRGAALLVVLFIVMVITILSLGFLTRSDVELACGQNMVLRTQMDYLAESGLEHARGLILNPQDVTEEYWTGAAGQQLVAGSDDYYDLEVVRDDSAPTNRCNYIIDCNSYRLNNGEKIGRSSLRGELRLDPCIALWTGNNTALSSGVTINGDVYCNGTLTNIGIIDGDVFANALTGSIAGQEGSVGDLSLVWPRVTVADFTSYYTTQTIISSSISSQTLGPYNPVRVCYRSGDLLLAGNVQVDGMLIVDGDLSIQGNSNIITAAKNLPALLVTGNLIVESGSTLEVNGLAVVDGIIRVSADATNINIVGGLFIDGGIVETTMDSSSSGNIGEWVGVSSYGPGVAGEAMSLDGTPTGGYVLVNHDDVLDGMSQLTLSVWAKKSIADVGGYVFHKHTVYYLEIQSNKIKSYVVNSIDDPLFLAETSESINDTQWHHYAMTYDSNAVRLYIDALEVGSPQSFSGNLAVKPTWNLYIGKNPWSNNFKGLIDDVRIFNRALNGSEIQQVKNGQAVGDLVGQWELNDSGVNLITTAAPSKTAIMVWSDAGIKEKWGQVTGAFFKSIERK